MFKSPMVAGRIAGYHSLPDHPLLTLRPTPLRWMRMPLHPIYVGVLTARFAAGPSPPLLKHDRLLSILPGANREIDYPAWDLPSAQKCVAGVFVAEHWKDHSAGIPLGLPAKS